MRARGFVRQTKQRMLILDVLRSTKCHPTADWVYQEVRKQLPSVSLGTVYRNLKMLTEMGEALELSYGSTFSRFDGYACPHYHFVCNVCGDITDLELPRISELEDRARALTGFQVEDHRLEFYGTCGVCKQSEVKEP